MADKKISQLDASTTPLAGTEELAVVQSGVTKKVSVANLTAGRAVSTGNLSVIGTATIDSVKINTTSGESKITIGTTTGSTTEYGLALEKLGGFGVSFIGNYYTSGSDYGLAFAVGARTNVMRYTVGGNLKIPNGIDFSADGQAAGMTSELLDDYEEGLYTPTFTPSTSGTIGLNTSNTRDKVMYTKVGRVVNLIAGIQFLGSSSPVGTSVTMTLPFAAFNGTGTTGSSATVFMYNGVAYNGQINNNATTMTWTINASTIADGSFLYFSITYVAA